MIGLLILFVIFWFYLPKVGSDKAVREFIDSYGDLSVTFLPVGITKQISNVEKMDYGPELIDVYNCEHVTDDSGSISITKSPIVSYPFTAEGSLDYYKKQPTTTVIKEINNSGEKNYYIKQIFIDKLQNKSIQMIFFGRVKNFWLYVYAHHCSIVDGDFLKMAESIK